MIAIILVSCRRFFRKNLKLARIEGKKLQPKKNYFERFPEQLKRRSRAQPQRRKKKTKIDSKGAQTELQNQQTEPQGPT